MVLADIASRVVVTQQTVPIGDMGASFRSLIERVVIADDTATLSGRQDTLQALLAAKVDEGLAVPTGFPEWCATPGDDDNYVYAIAL